MDVTDLTSSDALARWVADAAVGLVFVDRELHVTRVNAAAAEIDASALTPLAERVLDRGETVAGVELALHDRRCAATASPVRDAAGEIQAMAVALIELAPAVGGLDAPPPADRLSLALEGTATGFWEWDIATDRIRWSDNMGPLYGLQRGAQPSDYASYLDGLVAPEQREIVSEKVRTAVEEGRDYELYSHVTLPGGGERWIHSRAHVLRGDDGRPAAIIGVSSDVTESRRRELHLSFLSEATDRLFRSLDLVQTLNEIADLAVPTLADWCAVQLAAGDAGVQNLAVAHVDPEKVRWARELEEHYPPDPNATTGAPQVIRTGRSELYPTIDPALLEAGATDPEHLRIINELRMTSAMVVPLKAVDRTLGAITFIYAESGRHYGTTELALAEELGRRAGVALDHARLYARERTTAQTLQRALLPASLPAIDGHALAVRYRPGAVGDHAGGDFYDAFVLPSGRLGVVIGDIAGRGITAAATMGQVRNALRAYAVTETRPAAVVDRLHALGEALEDTLFATLAYLVLDPATGTGALASAGHLPPLMLQADGSSAYLDVPRCPPLGLRSAPPAIDQPIRLAPGATLLLYTDGLVERRDRSLDHGLAALREVVAGAPAGVDALADAVMASGLPEGHDDVALLALRRLG